MKKTKISIIGCGRRGHVLLHELLGMADVEVVALCDVYEDKAEKLAQLVREAKGGEPYLTTDYKAVIKNVEMDAVLVSTSWNMHVPITIAFMEAGIPVGFEVGGFYSVEDCWQLVHTHKRTGVECMMLENACYCRREMALFNMKELGVFGEIVHCDGSYCHDLREEIAYGKEIRHYRLQEFLNRNCENYPTHELLPIMKLLDIGRGNRMLSLTSTASKSAGMAEYIRQHKSDDAELMSARWAQGDVVTTVIQCARGETITLTLENTLPRFFSEKKDIHGTKAFYNYDTNTLLIDSEFGDESERKWSENMDNFDEKYLPKYEHPLWKEYAGMNITSGHGGIDWLTLRAFIESVRRGKTPPVDVYDAVAAAVISVLSEESISRGSAPVAIPDFTGGHWMEIPPAVEDKYCLNKVCDDPSVKVVPVE